MTVVVGTISRASLSLSDLAIGPTTAYRVLYEPAFDPGTVTRRRSVVTSPYVHGAFETESVMDRAFMSLQINVKATSHSAVQTALATLIAAVTQESYTLTLSLDGTSYAWTCYAADYGIGFTTQLLVGLQAPVSLSIPRDPIPASGPV